ncbi:hypothetical protein BC629DRAFT_593788 [Irpex lacteus]|nr:hypothetical protein BC629DRAFT_593788 [Irpex lacteus]
MYQDVSRKSYRQRGQVLPPTLRPPAFQALPLGPYDMSIGPIEACNFVESAAQTCTYGVCIVIFLMVSHISLKRGFNKRSNIVIFVVTIVAFAILSTQWMASTATFFVKIIAGSPSGALNVAGNIQLLFNAVLSTNLLFADAVVVWRMSVLCGETFPRKVPSIPATLLLATSVTTFITIIFRIYGLFASHSEDAQLPSRLVTAINITQVASIVLSLGTNFSATSLIAQRAWRYRKSMKGITHFGGSNHQLERILSLFVESGMLFCLSSIFSFVSMLLRTPLNCTLGDIYRPMHAQLAGMYPALIMVLVHSRSGANGE